MARSGEQGERGKLLRRQMIKVTSEQTERGWFTKKKAEAVCPAAARGSLSLSLFRRGGGNPLSLFHSRGRKSGTVHTNARLYTPRFAHRGWSLIIGIDLANSLRALVRWSDKSRPRPRPMRFYRCDRRYFWACCATEKEGPRGTKKKLGRNRFAEPIDEEIKFGGALYRSGSLNTICCKLSVSKLWY